MESDKTQAMKYAEMCALAYETIHDVMRQGEADNKTGWEERGIKDAALHASNHIEHVAFGKYQENYEEHLRHALTRCAMAYYLWKTEQKAKQKESIK